MKWEHKCSLAWLKERQCYLTASDIKSLLPVTKTGRKRDVSELEYLRVMSSKMVDLTEEDCMSYGAAARGHLLEPYAIDALNEMLLLMNGSEAEKFYWWDDEAVSLPGRSLAFSPDAMNVSMDDVDPASDVTAIAEVKSYSPERHIMTAYTPKEEIEERWQIATAMALLPNIDHAYLVLFNPKMEHRKTFVIRFDRSDLLHEIDVILDVEKSWDHFVDSGVLNHRSANGAIWSKLGGDEVDIAAEIEQRQRLNP
jgi:hypothetical protein